MKWSQEDAVNLCRALEEVAPEFGAHVALTGGCLYKDGERKDVDVLFYCIRQRDNIDERGLIQFLCDNLGFELVRHVDWLYKMKYEGRSIDMFFPENHPSSSSRGVAGGY